MYKRQNVKLHAGFVPPLHAHQNSYFVVISTTKINCIWDMQAMYVGAIEASWPIIIMIIVLYPRAKPQTPFMLTLAINNGKPKLDLSHTTAFMGH